MKGMLAVDCLGNRRTRRGGLALLWKEEGWDVSIMSFSVNHIDVMIEDDNGVSWHFLRGFMDGPRKRTRENGVIDARPSL